MKRALLALGITVLLFGSLALSASAATGTRIDILDARHVDNVNNFNLGLYPVEYRQAVSEGVQPVDGPRSSNGRQSIGSSLSPNAGIGKGLSIDQTWHDVQYTWGIGRQINTWYNGLTGVDADVSVHFAYCDQVDTLPGLPGTFTGYNVYDATGAGSWPRGQDVGCDLQATDTAGTAWLVSMDMMDNGRVVMAAANQFFLNPSTTEDARIYDNMIFYQGAEYNCTYDPRSGLNVNWIDTSVYRPLGMNQDDGNYARDPQIATQWDGSNTIVHLVMGESNATPLTGDAFADDGNTDYRTYTYYKKVGNSSFTGTWTSGQIIDTMWFVWGSLAAAPYPHTAVAYSYTNVTYYGGLLNQADDNDVWVRESFDRGDSWDPAYSVTEYKNALAGDPAHAKAWLETFAMYDSEGDLHILWGATPTSDDPYFDGFNWSDFNNNLMHWEKTIGNVVPTEGQYTGDIAKIANGTFMNPDQLSGSMNTLHCGFGGSNALYLAFAQMGECDGKLYALWSQIHERANRFPWRDAETQPAPGVLDDCSVVGERLAMANWEVMMSVAKMETSGLWDYPRSVSDTYTPNCGIVGLEGHEEAEGPCGSEWKPSVEAYALDETGLTLTWPAETIVDMSPLGDYAGGWYLNMHYQDDQFPGPAFWGRTNPPGTENSEKWIRLACVEPIEASQIAVEPFSLEWPEWVELGQSNAITVTVRNEGNVVLNVDGVNLTETSGSGWLSATINPAPGSEWQVTAGVNNENTFDVIIDASGLSATAWLDGEVEITSDAANFPSVTIPIHVLAAEYVEPVYWDTVMTHENMFDIYFFPEGECVALAVGNNGDLGWGAGSVGAVNLDYVESDLECGTRGRDGYYLIGASAFTILADDASGTNGVLTQSFNDGDQADETGWDPIAAPLTGVTTTGMASFTGTGTAGDDYDAVYTGRFVNQDTTIAMERTIYGPRSADPANDIINFVVMHTKVYSGDGAGHDHVTIGNVVDWDVPAEEVPNNTSGLSSDGFIYMQGTDTTGVLSCQSHTERFATEAFIGASMIVDGACTGAPPLHGVNALLQTVMVDTTHTRDGVVLNPDQPLVDVWWAETGVAGLNGDPTVQDQAIFMTYVHDYSLAAGDTLNYYTVLSTTRSGTLGDLEAQVEFAKAWAVDNEIAILCGGCCDGRVGDANGLGGDEPTIGDVSVMIDAKFITGSCAPDPENPIIACLQEGDINQSGGADPTCDDITIGDISILIDYLFITGPSLGLNDCL